MHFLIFKICFSLFVLEVVYMDTLKEYYLSAGISEDVYCFCDKVQESLKERFEEIDQTAEFNQIKVLRATVSACVPHVSCGRTRADSAPNTLAYTSSSISLPKSS